MNSSGSLVGAIPNWGFWSFAERELIEVIVCFWAGGRFVEGKGLYSIN